MEDRRVAPRPIGFFKIARLPRTVKNAEEGKMQSWQRAGAERGTLKTSNTVPAPRSNAICDARELFPAGLIPLTAWRRHVRLAGDALSTYGADGVHLINRFRQIPRPPSTV
ncbi:hypothetical protein SKAU_G00323960 [Synaphobranchus kaupii]|uniref:Uncharacterized protein n=1 Tax=Synaphobranchus kaupii TaxID=118154 RepID=A0A9Q1EPD8_SYNKA|nr:hypothetical protein SKAU_G00323960 [Synaphobranchus kaupii]